MKVLIGKVNRKNKCKVDIRKKDILGTYRIKQMKKNSTWPRIEPALSRLKD